MKRHISSSFNLAFRLSFLITFIFLFVQNPVRSQSNLITNGDFEYGTIGWTSWGASLSLTSDSHSGNYAVRVSNRINSWNALVKDISNLLVNGNTYTCLLY